MFMPGPPAEVLTLALAMTEKLTLALAETAALPATAAHAIACPLSLAMSLATEVPMLARFVAAVTKIGPCVWTAWMRIGRFFWTVITTACTPALAEALHWRATVGGVQLAWRFALLWQVPWQFTFEVHLAGVTEPSHVGAVTITLQPPLHVAIAPQLTPPVAVTLQLPLHDPLHVPLQCPGLPGVIMHAASHLPLHVPLQAPVLGIPVPPLAVQVPLQLPMHVPLQSIVPAIGGVQVPVQSASHEPWHWAWTLAEPSQVAPTMHIPLHWPLSDPGSHVAVTLGAVQLAMPLHEASQLASTLAIA
jgi:hypothetical protein